MPSLLFLLLYLLLFVFQFAVCCKAIIGASLSEPHIDEFAVEFVYIIYILSISRTSCRKSLPTLILRVLASFVNSKTIHKLLVLNLARRHQLSSNSKDGDHSWTYLFNGWNDRCYRMAKRFHLSMPLFVLPLTVEVTGYMDRPLQWPHR